MRASKGAAPVIHSVSVASGTTQGVQGSVVCCLPRWTLVLEAGFVKRGGIFLTLLD